MPVSTLEMRLEFGGRKEVQNICQLLNLSDESKLKWNDNSGFHYYNHSFRILLFK